MANCQTKTPVAILIYKRPSTTEKVFEAIRQAKPSKLLVVANAPRLNKPGEAEQCAAARSIIERVDWDCEVLKNYADQHLSCKDRIASGLNWIFDNAERAVIFEDDCVPHPTFFQFCDQVLERYQDDERVMAISGTCPNIGTLRTDYSYYFSCYNLYWGWASWRRAWKHYDADMKLWPKIRDEDWLFDILGDRRAVEDWSWRLQRTYEGVEISTWDDQCTLACWIHNGLCIVPKVNLVSNIGFGIDSAHTKDKFDWRANVPTEPIQFPLKHPEFVVRDARADTIMQREYFERIAQQKTLVEKVRRKIRRAEKIWEEFRTQNYQGGFLELVQQVIKE